MVSILFQSGPRRRQAIGLLLAASFSPSVVALYSILRTPIFMDKLFLPSATLLPIFALLPLSMPLAPMARRFAWAGAALLLLFSAATLYGFHEEDNKEEWREVAATIAQWPAAHRLFVFVANDGQLPFDYYYHYRPGEEATGVPGGFFDLNPPRTMRRLYNPSRLASLRSRLDTEHYDQVVLMLSHQFWGDPNHLTQKLVASRFPLARQQDFYDVKIQWYGKNGR